MTKQSATIDYSLAQVYRRVSDWNAARYERIHNQELGIRLLEEELMEFFNSQEAVDRLDGLCDTVYVAFGILWKHNYTEEELQELFDKAFEFVDSLPNNMLVYAAYAKACIHSMGYGADNAQMAATIITLCNAEAVDSLQLGHSEFLQALNVVCDSNDSKIAKKTASDVKANEGNKGSAFVAPEPRLQFILDNRARKGEVNG